MEPTSLPPNFVRPLKLETPPEAEARRSFVSERVHGLLFNSISAKAAYFPSPNDSLISAAPDGTSDAFVMEKFEVKSPLLRAIDLQETLTKMHKFQENGVVYKKVGRQFTFDTMFYVDRWYSNRQGSGGVETRLELRFNFRW